MRDRLFATDPIPPGGFHFGPQVAEVFDDMVVRSVPQYEALQGIMATLALRCSAGRPIYDLGCSTGTTLSRVAQRAAPGQVLVGFDNSEAMLARSRTKLGTGVLLENRDLETLASLPHDSIGAIILCLVLMFLAPPRREPLLRMAWRHLAAGGCLLVVEKVRHEEPQHSILVAAHEAFKRGNGYSEAEIERKREALENRLIPWRPGENLAMLRGIGAEPEIFFAALNFQGYLAIKP
ncbi:MAG TPA: methyltransferase domain-containing protein [Candidatus Xenobia bacterium]|jgi:tRNA (cmo5U34)-methyltransferase